MTGELGNIAAMLMSAGKGILAADESLATMQKRFDTVGLTYCSDADECG